MHDTISLSARDYHDEILNSVKYNNYAHCFSCLYPICTICYKYIFLYSQPCIHLWIPRKKKEGLRIVIIT